MDAGLIHFSSWAFNWCSLGAGTCPQSERFNSYWLIGNRRLCVRTIPDAMEIFIQSRARGWVNDAERADKLCVIILDVNLGVGTKPTKFNHKQPFHWADSRIGIRMRRLFIIIRWAYVTQHVLHIYSYVHSVHQWHVPIKWGSIIRKRWLVQLTGICVRFCYYE